MTNNQNADQLLFLKIHLATNELPDVDDLYLYYSRPIREMMKFFLTIATSTEYILKEVFYTQLPKKIHEITSTETLEKIIFSEIIQLAQQEFSAPVFDEFQKEIRRLELIFSKIRTLNKKQIKIITLKLQYKPMHLIAKEMNITETQTIQTIKQAINKLIKQIDPDHNIPWAVFTNALLK